MKQNARLGDIEREALRDAYNMWHCEGLLTEYIEYSKNSIAAIQFANRIIENFTIRFNSIIFEYLHTPKLHLIYHLVFLFHVSDY